MATYLDRIAAFHRARADSDDRPLEVLRSRADGIAKRPSLRDSISESSTVAVIAEVKRRSPSKGLLNGSLDVATLVTTYEMAGAAAVSVLTDSEHFGGSSDDLIAARDATSLPLLRKDFTVSPRDVIDARLWGASAVLLIVAILADRELRLLFEEASHLGLDAFFEVHDTVELGRALDAGASVVGVNQRDLVTFEVDTARAVRVGASIPAGVLSVAESGISELHQVETLARSGFDAILVGESLVRHTDPAAALRVFSSVERVTR